jgi:hypothetical protein
MALTDWSAPQHHIQGEPKGLKYHFNRFRRSPHCQDLLFIAVAAGVFCIVALLVCIFVKTPEAFIAVLGIALTVVGWAYQAANTRFGVVDLFAAEIATLCRVSAVSEFIPNSIRRYYAGGDFPKIESLSDYIVIFDNHAKDLEILDGDVVRYVTQFYVYTKALTDAVSRGALAKGPRNNPGALNIVYNAFLAFESARQALTVLMDDGVERTEYVLTAMLSEVPAYLLLLSEIRDSEDVRFQRLSSRLRQYQVLIGQIETDIRLLEPASEALAKQVVRVWNESVHEEDTIVLPERLRVHPPAPIAVASEVDNRSAAG